MVGRAAERTDPLEPYVPRVLAEWDLDAPGDRWQRVDGTLCFVDISGFTNLSEKLASRGRIGAEELTEVLDRVFGNMLRLAYDRGGNLLKFGGDALLLLFEGDDHAIQGVCAAVEMRAALREAVKIPTSVGKIRLRMSVGVHTGPIDLFRAGGSHHELIITGDTATKTTEMEATADPGEIVISPELRAVLPKDAASAAKGSGWILRWTRPRSEAPGPVPRRTLDAATYDRCVPTQLRGYLRETHAEPEHRIATVGFVKFKGIGAAWTEGGPKAVADGLDGLVTTVQQAVDPEAVTFLATDIDEDGGKIILTTGVPATQADDEGRMLRALRRIAESDPPFPLKIGANRGHVFAGEIGTEFRSTYTVMGDTVNLAARLMAAAPPGEVYAAPGVLDRSFTLFETKALPPFYVKGKTAPVQAYGVGPETGRRPAVSRGELPFTGRDSELGQVNTAIAALEQGTGSAITVLGETGYGKTRLVFEALAGVDQDEQLLIRAEPYGTDNPYWALRDPLRALLGIERADQQTMISRLASVVESLDPALGPVVPLIGDVMQIEVPDTPDTAAIEPRFRPDRTAAAVVRLLEAMSPARLVVVVEDAHWLDQASTELVTMLGSVAAPLHPWLVIVTTRPGDGAPAELVGTVLELGPLPDEAVRRIAITMTEAAPLRPHDMDAVVERAAGNPLFLGEILRLVRETGSTEELPESLDAVVGSQIDTLPPLPRRLLRYSSVLGRSFRKVVLDELLRPEDVELDAASRRVLARFIEEDGAARYRFRHSVMHDVAYAGLSYRKRKELHGRAGEVIERLAGDDTDAVAEFLALHYAEAGDHEKAWRYGVVAGDRARVNFANIEASRHYRRALAAARSLQIDSEAELAIRRSLGDVLEQAALYREAVASYSRAVRLADDTVTAADLRLRSARARLRLGSYRSALGDIARATKAIKEDDHVSDVGALARLLSFRAVIYQSQQRPGDALRLATQAESLARETEEAVALARSLGVMDWAAWMLGRPEDATRSGEAIDIYLRTGHLDLAANLLNNTGGFAYFEGRWDDALDLYGRSRRAFEQAGNVAGAALADANIAEILINRGDPGGSEPLVQRAVRVLESTDSIDDLLFAEMQLARFLILDGDLSQAIERIDRLVDDAERAGRSGFATELTVLAAEAYNSTGDGPAALHALERIQESAQQSTAFFRSRIAVERSRALLSMDRIGDVLQEIEVGLSAADVNGLIYDRLLLLEERAAVGRRVTGSTDEALLVEVAGLRSKLGLNPATRPSLSLP